FLAKSCEYRTEKEELRLLFLFEVVRVLLAPKTDIAALISPAKSFPYLCADYFFSSYCKSADVLYNSALWPSQL
ncbi:hypothetical protein AB4560_16460, partial [Vibrio sp. 10N.222.51.C12]|uniref:hypothetical protein n=1 Tax=Vibrio sp. 10N.222.51.C12 TaxID=3229622 RepID=UPI001A7E0E67